MGFGSFLRDIFVFDWLFGSRQVKTGIRINEESVNWNSCIAHHAEKLFQRIFNLVDIMVLTGFWFGYGDWNILTVRDKYGIGRMCRLCAPPPTSSSLRSATVWLPSRSALDKSSLSWLRLSVDFQLFATNCPCITAETYRKLFYN